MNLVKNSILNLIDFCLPNYCLICNSKAHKQVCKNCLPKWTANKYFLGNSNNQIQQIAYIWNYDQRTANFIKSMKYKPSIQLSKLAGKILAKKLKYLFDQFNWDIIIPIPSNKLSFKNRKFNQCIYIAREIKNEISQYKNIYISYNSLKYRKQNKQQALLNLKDRKSNLKNAFSCKDRNIINKKILLIDDVITTGATSLAASQALINAGAKEIDLLTLAKS